MYAPQYTIGMLVLLIARPKWTLAALHAAPWWVTVSMPTGQTNRQMDGPLHYAFCYGSSRCNNTFAQEAGVWCL